MNINWSQPIPLSWIPNGKLVTFTALHQAALTQYVQIIDPSGKPISFTTLTGNSVQFPISGTGTNVGFFENGAGSFYMQQGYQIQFANSGGQTSLVSQANPTQFFIFGQVFGGGSVFVTEDQGGTDYNDTSLWIEWYAFQG
jgi:mannose-binding lectin